MPRSVSLAAIQPPIPGPGIHPGRTVEIALDLLDRAAGDGADIACLPEYLNVIGRPDEEWLDPPPADELIARQFIRQDRRPETCGGLLER